MNYYMVFYKVNRFLREITRHPCTLVPLSTSTIESYPHDGINLLIFNDNMQGITNNLLKLILYFMGISIILILFIILFTFLILMLTSRYDRWSMPGETHTRSDGHGIV